MNRAKRLINFLEQLGILDPDSFNKIIKKLYPEHTFVIKDNKVFMKGSKIDPEDFASKFSEYGFHKISPYPFPSNYSPRKWAGLYVIGDMHGGGKLIGLDINRNILKLSNVLR